MFSCLPARASPPAPLSKPQCLAPPCLPLQVASDARVDCQLAELLLMDHKAQAVLRSRAESRDNIMAAVQLRLVSGCAEWHACAFRQAAVPARAGLVGQGCCALAC
jgi:hypothetical protein